MSVIRRVNQFNRQFAKFGYSPFGDLRYCWKHTTDLHYLIQVGSDEWKRRASGLLTREPRYERHTWADTPHGQQWMVAQWTPPISQDEWVTTLGTSFPWPHMGQYNPIENMGCHDGGCDCKDRNSPPDDSHTRGAIKALAFHLGHKTQELADMNLAQYHAHRKSICSEIESDLDDTLTAWGRIPGSNDGTISILNEAYRKAKPATIEEPACQPQP